MPQSITQWVTAHVVFVAGALVILAIVAVVAIVLAIAALIANSTLRRRFKRWKSMHATADLEAVYQQTLEEIERLRAEFDVVQKNVQTVRQSLRAKVSTARLQRYNAFADGGGDLSFSVALLDDDANGVVLSSIYGRQESRTYAKPVTGGSSNYPLTEEETGIIAEAAATTERS